jgi:hypothetical protein
VFFHGIDVLISLCNISKPMGSITGTSDASVSPANPERQWKLLPAIPGKNSVVNPSSMPRWQQSIGITPQTPASTRKTTFSDKYSSTYF